MTTSTAVPVKNRKALFVLLHDIFRFTLYGLRVLHLRVGCVNKAEAQFVVAVVRVRKVIYARLKLLQVFAIF